MSESFFCYLTTTKSGDEYFVYWQSDASILGVTNMADNVFEMTLDRRDRKKLLKNVAESLVESKWRSVFANKGLKLRDVRNDAVELFYVVECVTIPRIDDSALCRNRNAALLKNALNEIGLLSGRIKPSSNGVLPKSTSSTVSSPPPAHLIISNTLLNKTQSNTLNETVSRRRKRGNATGVVFSDSDE